MKKFEYDVRKKYHGYSQDELNVFGQTGWELCGIEHDSFSGDTTYIFKRELL
jgi:hypothetical protein